MKNLYFPLLCPWYHRVSNFSIFFSWKAIRSAIIQALKLYFPPNRYHKMLFSPFCSWCHRVPNSAMIFSWTAIKTAISQALIYVQWRVIFQCCPADLINAKWGRILILFLRGKEQEVLGALNVTKFAFYSFNLLDFVS